MTKIYMIGIGMGNPETITVAGKNAVNSSDGIIGAKRIVDSFADYKGACGYGITPEEIVKWIESNDKLKEISVVFSGDIGFFSGAKKLREELDGKYQVEMIPGISSLQYFCAKLQTPWEDAKILSLHGRDADFIGELRTHKKTFILTDKNHSPQLIASELVNAGLGETDISIGENLSYKDEKITTDKAKNISDKSFASLSVVLVQNENVVRRISETYGIEDDFFVRGNVPMTKEEVRTISLSKLKIREEDIIYDVGAGTGSVSIEMALRALKGSVYAIETNAEAVALIEKNRDKSQIKNLYTVSGMAPDAFEGLPIPDKAFLGGTKGNIKEILDKLLSKNPLIRVVINLIALESIGYTLDALKALNFDVLDIVQVSISKAKRAGSYHLMMGQNPVTIITAQGKVEK